MSNLLQRSQWHTADDSNIHLVFFFFFFSVLDGCDLMFWLIIHVHMWPFQCEQRKITLWTMYIMAMMMMMQTSHLRGRSQRRRAKTYTTARRHRSILTFYATMRVHAGALRSFDGVYNKPNAACYKPTGAPIRGRSTLSYCPFDGWLNYRDYRDARLGSHARGG